MAGQNREPETQPALPYADRVKAAHEFFETKVDPPTMRFINSRRGNTASFPSFCHAEERANPRAGRFKGVVPPLVLKAKEVVVRRRKDGLGFKRESSGVNDAVGRLLGRSKISRIPFVHGETEGMIDASYLCAKPPKGDYHLQNLRSFISKDKDESDKLKECLHKATQIAGHNTWKDLES